MSRYETAKAPEDRPFAQAGIGLAVTRRCDGCRRLTMDHAGGSYGRFGLWYCAPCTTERAQRKATKAERAAA